MRLARAHRIYEVEAVVTKARTHTQKKNRIVRTPSTEII